MPGMAAAKSSGLDEAIGNLQQAGREIRAVLEEMAVVPSAHRSRLIVAARLIEAVRAHLASLDPA
jgi:hypothetical protein